jgi:hypothetical protein
MTDSLVSSQFAFESLLEEHLPEPLGAPEAGISLSFHLVSQRKAAFSHWDDSLLLRDRGKG